MTREKMSRPSSSEPKSWFQDGRARRVGRSICAESCGASQGAKIAQVTNSTTKTIPMAARGFFRRMRRNEMASAGTLGTIVTCEQVSRFRSIVRWADNAAKLEVGGVLLMRDWNYRFLDSAAWGVGVLMRRSKRYSIQNLPPLR